MSSSGPSIEILEIRITAQSVLKSVELSIGSFKQESPCLLGVKAHKVELLLPCQLSPSNPLCLRVRYRNLWNFTSKNKIHHDEVLKNTDTQSSSKQEWSKSYDKFDVVLGLTVSPHAGNASIATRGTSTGADLQPTTDVLFKLVDRFRVLVIGKVPSRILAFRTWLHLCCPQTGAGKSSLINRCFGVTEAVISDSEAGVSNINTPIIARENGRFVLHDSQGFEPGEEENFETVIKFLKTRNNMPNVRDQVHAVWLCFPVPLSADERLFESGVEKFFRMKDDGELGLVPVVTIFTKYDQLVDEVEYARGSDFYHRAKALDAKARSALLVEMTSAKFQEFCVRPFEEVIGSDIPRIAVSTNEEYEGTSKSLNELTQLTADCVRKCLSVEVAEDVAVLSAVAQRVNPAVKIDAVIAVGKKRYWRGLASSVNFRGKTIEACLQVLHTDIVQVWNIQDDFAYLESKEFKALMISLAGEQYGELSDPSTTIVLASPLFGTLTALIGGLSAQAAPIVIPIAATFVLAKWAYDVYQQSALLLQRLMAYIVDFTIIMQIIFGLVVNAQLRLSRRLIKLAFTAYNESRERIQVHNEIKDHVKQAGRTDRDAALAKMLQLIKDCQMKPEDMDQLQRTMAGFDNIEDEPWDVRKA